MGCTYWVSDIELPKDVTEAEPTDTVHGRTDLATYDSYGSFEITVKTKDGREYSFLD